jgi:hypothetical protein
MRIMIGISISISRVRYLAISFHKCSAKCDIFQVTLIKLSKINNIIHVELFLTIIYDNVVAFIADNIASYYFNG